MGESWESTDILGSHGENVPDRQTCHATATNTCGLEVSNNKECGEAKRYKFFDICGGIKVCEHVKSYGCEGERECSDGRYTKTSQTYSALADTDLGTLPGGPDPCAECECSADG